MWEGQRDTDLLGLGPEWVVNRVSVLAVAGWVGAEHDTLGPSLDGALHLLGGEGRVEEADMGDRDEAVGGFTAPVDEPVVIGSAVGVGELGVGAAAFPGDAEGRVQEDLVDALLVEDGETFGRVPAPGGEGYALFVGDDTGGKVRFEVSADGAHVAEDTVPVAPGLAVDDPLVPTLTVLLQVKCAVSVLGFEIALPEVGGFKDVAVGIDYHRESPCCESDDVVIDDGAGCGGDAYEE